MLNKRLDLMLNLLLALGSLIEEAPHAVYPPVPTQVWDPELTEEQEEQAGNWG